ncbi:MAG: DUF1841 family protein [Woeseiaceae bacterium]|nr:DUF1841 family protein [Woeseiaceae bacterium]
MIFSQNRTELRRMYVDAWAKHQDALPLTALEAQIVDVIAEHPEYRDALESASMDRDYLPEDGETNPYLHLGLHLGLREQIATDRPAGIAEVFRTIAARLGDRHSAEHRMIDCLAETLWDAQRHNRAPDEQYYLERLRQL